MHVLLLKDPRNGESGIDPYIKVDGFFSSYFITLRIQYF